MAIPRASVRRAKMAWVVGKWAWVDGSGSKVLFAQIDISMTEIREIRLREIRFLLGLTEFNSGEGEFNSGVGKFLLGLGEFNSGVGKFLLGAVN